MHAQNLLRNTFFAFFLLAGLLACGTAPVHAQTETQLIGDMVDFYVVPESLVVFPPQEDSLEIKRTKMVDKRHVTFIGPKSSNAACIVAVTVDPIKDLRKSIVTTVTFEGIQPRVGRVTSWGYVFDRNNDGKVDYMALLAGAAPVEPEEMPEGYPPRGVNLTEQQLEFYANHCQMVFNHWADDNFDGKLDGVVHIDMDPVREWVQRRIVARSTKFDGKLDEVWAFRGPMGSTREKVSKTRTGVPFRNITGRDGEISPKMFAQQNDILALINRAVAVSGLRRDQLPITSNVR